jgi:hypothetical protein
MLVHAIMMLQDKIMKESVKDRAIPSTGIAYLDRSGTLPVTEGTALEKETEIEVAQNQVRDRIRSVATRTTTIIVKSFHRRDAETQKRTLNCSLRLRVSAVYVKFYDRKTSGVCRKTKSKGRRLGDGCREGHGEVRSSSARIDRSMRARF